MSAPIESSFERLLVGLVRDQVEFVTVGGIAVCLNGYVRLTEDVDILIEGSRENAVKLIASLSKFGQGFAAELLPEDFSDEEGAIRIVEDSESCMIDVFTLMRGLRFEDLRKHLRQFPIGEHHIPYLDPEGLIILKEKTHREKDAVDVSALRQLMQDPNAFD